MKKSIIVLLVLLVIIVVIGVGFVTYKIGENKGKEDKQGMNESNRINNIVNEIDNTKTNQNTISSEVNNNSQNITLSESSTQTLKTLEIGKTFKWEDSQGGASFTLLAGNKVEESAWATPGGITDYYGSYKIENDKLIITTLGDYMDGAYDEPYTFTYTITGYNKCEREYNGRTLVYTVQ